MEQKCRNMDMQNILRSDELAKMLLIAIQQYESQHIGWLAANGYDAGSHGNLEASRIIKEEIKARAYDDALVSKTSGTKVRHVTIYRRRLPQAIAASLVAVLVGGFLFTEPGRAFAKDTYAALASWLNGVFSIQQKMPELPHVSSLNYDELPEFFESVHSAAKYLQRSVAVIENDTVSIKAIQAFKEDGILVTLQTTYLLPSGETVLMWQYFYDPNTHSIGATSKVEDGSESYILPNDATMYYGYSVNQRDALGKAAWPYGQLFISGTGLESSVLKELIQRIVFIEPQ